MDTSRNSMEPVYTMMAVSIGYTIGKPLVTISIP